MSRRRHRDRTGWDKPTVVTTKHPQEENQPPSVNQLCTEISAYLRDITADAARVEALTTTTQRRMVVLTADAKAAMDAMVAHEHTDAARRQAAEPIGHAWMRPGQDSKTHGKTDAPGDVSALSISADITRTLRHIVIDLTDYEHVDLVPDLVWIEQVANTAARIRTLTRVAGEPERGLLERTHKGLEKLDARVRALIDGHNERSVLRDPCPHCGRDTLIVWWDQQLIRCDRSPKSKHYAACTCSDPLCECKNRPVGYRHTWYAGKPARSSHSWQALSSRLNALRALTTTPTKQEPPR